MYKLIMFCEIIGKGKEVNKIVTNKKRKHTCVACVCVPVTIFHL